MSEAAKPRGEQDKITMITVRLPKSLHKKLRVIAAEAERSLNKECLQALINHVTRVGTPET
jgi:predicted HicB family RNase H-like nuclease